MHSIWRSAPLRFLAVAGTAFALSGCSNQTPEQICRATLNGVTHLIVVAVEDTDSARASIAVYGRGNTGQNARWRLASEPEAAVVGRAGAGWGGPYRGLARTGEASKREGDKRAPLGVYGLGPTFGFDDVPKSDNAALQHLRLRPKQHVCVDDPSSPYYGQIVSRQEAGATTSAEEMAAIPLYRRGIVVQYPSDGRLQSGSCIFIHIWQGENAGTVGCVATTESKVGELQLLVRRHKTAIVIWPRGAAVRLARCIPGLSLDQLPTLASG